MPWKKGRGYDVEQLTNVYTGDHLWAGKVVQAIEEKIGEPRTMRALAFCVSVNHARFMAQQFEEAGLRAVAVTAETPADERAWALAALQDGEIQIVCAVDLFNEGVDLPAIDTVLMLRPTESATIFLQQLGRGLRRFDGKDVLTVLDFVGHQAKEFRFDLRYRRMLGRSRTELVDDIEQDFPYLPAGSRLQLDRVAKEIVLDNIKHALPTTWKDRQAELRELGDVSLGEYLHETGLELDDIYRGNHTWTELRRAAGIDATAAMDDEARLGRGIARLLHVDDQERIEQYARLVGLDRPPSERDLSERDRRRLEGLLLTVMNPRKGGFGSLDEASESFWRHTALRHELTQVLDLLDEQVVHLHEPLDLPYPVPLQVHGTYTREEVLGAFGVSTVVKPVPLQTGVYWHEETNTDLFFVTLQKTEREYSPTTRYLDYAISDRLFHWESQSTTSVASETGQRYLNHRERGTNVVLFIRSQKKNAVGRTMPYFCAGTARYVEHTSDRPIQITWRLDRRLPGDVFTAYRAAVA